MINDQDTLDILRTGDPVKIIQYLQSIPNGELRKALVADFLALANLLRKDRWILYDADYKILPWWQEQEWREEMVVEHSNPDAWSNWPDEYLEFLFTKIVVGFDDPVDLNQFLDVAYLMPNLEYLKLSRQAPEAGSLHLRNLDKLWDLECTKSGISELAWDLSRLSELKKIDLSQNKISSIPEEWSGMSLEIIDLHANALESVPPWLFSLTSLRRLNLADNRLRKIRQAVGGITTDWEFLSLEGNQIDDLAFLETINSIGWLNIGGNNALSYPSKLPEVKTMILDSTQWNHMAPMFRLGLHTIWITGGNVIMDLDAIGVAVEGVRSLDIRMVEIKFGGSLRMFTGLQNIYVSNAASISGLPDGLFELEKLESISFLNCNIKSLKGPWSNFGNLKRVSFQSCGITDVPEEFFSLSRKVVICLVGNHIPKDQKAMLKRHFKDLDF